ncbi:hypothetical protein BGP77_17585 [Saccharospirillum sp. MSK14-1]|uniref:hypothetical protein n=1 Tax=Saccharospirillum sp. MSK14-1 TaxID=1897632 RepID=UPI000D382EDA|nr:hypothetical protein [Saccharospirillum sp. MSK14-1]PTY38251.1 hypothetical protein BGP77_17585 [Saccharospirillum sp. MSK14-1]
MKDNHRSIQAWVAERTHFSFLFPDGSTIGRSFESHYSVERVEQTVDQLVVYLSDNMVFEIDGAFEVLEEGYRYEMSGFTRLRFFIGGVIQREYTLGTFCLAGF